MFHRGGTVSRHLHISAPPAPPCPLPLPSCLGSPLSCCVMHPLFCVSRHLHISMLHMARHLRLLPGMATSGPARRCSVLQQCPPPSTTRPPPPPRRTFLRRLFSLRRRRLRFCLLQRRSIQPHSLLLYPALLAQHTNLSRPRRCVGAAAAQTHICHVAAGRKCRFRTYVYGSLAPRKGWPPFTVLCNTCFVFPSTGAAKQKQPAGPAERREALARQVRARCAQHAGPRGRGAPPRCGGSVCGRADRARRGAREREAAPTDGGGAARVRCAVVTCPVPC
jgi:hypothetical protein